MSYSTTQSETLAIDIPEFYTPLYKDFLAGVGPADDPAPSAFRDLSRWEKHAEDVLSGSGGGGELWREVQDLNRRLGASEPAMSNIEGLAARRSLAVVAGQQPGLLGGPLLVPYKAATAVALSEFVSGITRMRCSPVFIVGSDDSDLTEIAQCTMYDAHLRRLVLRFSGLEHTAGRMVGGLPVQEEMEVAKSLGIALAGAPGLPAVSELLEGVGAKARDHGEFVAALLCALFSARGLVIIDGRSPAMRRAGVPLFRSYVAHREQLRDAVAEAGRRMTKSGYHAQIGGGSLDWWLFIVEDGLRKKVGVETGGVLERILGNSPESVSPNVALRPILRDWALPTVCCVCGPSEVAYTLQLRGAYRILGVRMPVVFPRLGVTLVPPEGEELAGGWSEPALQNLLTEFERTQASHYRGMIPQEVVHALELAKASVDGSIAGLADVVRDQSDQWGKAADLLRKSTGRGLARLEQEVLDSVRRDRQKENPRLGGVGGFLLPDGKLQERALSSLYPLVEGDSSFAERAVALARSHIERSVEGRVLHYCCRIENRRARPRNQAATRSRN